MIKLVISGFEKLTFRDSLYKIKYDFIWCSFSNFEMKLKNETYFLNSVNDDYVWQYNSWGWLSLLNFISFWSEIPFINFLQVIESNVCYRLLEKLLLSFDYTRFWLNRFSLFSNFLHKGIIYIREFNTHRFPKGIIWFKLQTTTKDNNLIILFVKFQVACSKSRFLHSFT